MRNKHPATWWQWAVLGAGYVLLPTAALWLLYLVDRPAVPPDDLAVDPAVVTFVASQGEVPPESGWQPLVGAQLWGIEMEPFYSAWFRMPVQPSDRAALYLPEPRANVVVFVGTQPVFQSGEMSMPLPYFRTPLLIDLPAILEPGWLYLRVARQPENIFPPQAYLGSRADLTGPYADRLFVHRWLPLILVASMTPVMLILGGMFLFGRRESAYGWYALTLLLWGAHTVHAVIDRIPFHHNIWFILNYMALSWVVTEIIFINRFFDFRTKRTERFLIWTTVLLSGVFLMVGWLGHTVHVTWFAQYVFTPWTMLCAFYVAALYFVALFTRWSFESVSLWLISSVFTAAAIRDWLYEFGVGFIDVPGSMYYLQYVVLLPMTFFGAMLVRRHVEALRASEVLNAELEDRVADKAHELEETYERLAAEEKRRTLAEERARLMRDMHDGLGGQLVHALGLSEQSEDPELKRALRFALDDLRLIIDSLAPEENTLHALLASYRHRTTRVINRQGIELVWQLDELASTTSLSPERALGVMRIVQEAITNSVRHARCGTIVVTATGRDGDVALSVADDGIGIGSGSPGRGLSNMEVRASEVGGKLDIESGDHGTTVRVALTSI